MIVLQILLIPLVALVLLSLIFVLGSSGIEPPKRTPWIEQDVIKVNKLDSSWTTNSIYLQHRALISKKSSVRECDDDYPLGIIDTNFQDESLINLPIIRL